MQFSCDERIGRIEAALSSPSSPWDEAEAAVARADIAEIQARRAIAGGHVVAALVGGTGSGKSSLFNALTGTDLADAGALRPTTEAATAFAWGPAAPSLIDYLGIDPGRVISRTTELERAHEKALDGLVLLDLPDHDSVKDAHSSLVDRLLPLVDVLVWVVDPQKYADHILHSVYLARMRRRADAMVLVMNHVDRVPPARRDALLADVGGVLELDGLPDVPVLATSAVSGDGVDELRKLLAVAGAEPSMVERTASAELDAVVGNLKTKLAAEEPAVDQDMVDQASRELVTACGVDAVVDALQHAIAHPKDASVPPSQSPSYATVAAIGSTWTMKAEAGLPEVWAERVDAVLPGVGELGAAVHGAVTSVPRPRLVDPGERALRIGGYAAIALGIVAAVLGFTVLARVPLLTAAAVLVAGGAVALGAARARLRARATTAPRDYYDAVLDAVRAVVRERLVEPTVAVLAEHEELRVRLG